MLQGMEEVDTGSSGRMGWEGKEQELHSVQRDGCSVQEVAYGASWPRARDQEQRTDEQGWCGGMPATHWLVKKWKQRKPSDRWRKPQTCRLWYSQGT